MASTTTTKYPSSTTLTKSQKHNIRRTNKIKVVRDYRCSSQVQRIIEDCQDELHMLYRRAKEVRQVLQTETWNRTVPFGCAGNLQNYHQLNIYYTPNNQRACFTVYLDERQLVHSDGKWQ